MSTFLLGHYKKLFYLDKYYTLRKKVVVWRPWSVFFLSAVSFLNAKEKVSPQKKVFQSHMELSHMDLVGNCQHHLWPSVEFLPLARVSCVLYMYECCFWCRYKRLYFVFIVVCFYPVEIYLLKVNSGHKKIIYEICSRLTIKTPRRWHWCLSVSIINAEQISHIPFPLLPLNKLMHLGTSFRITYYSIILNFIWEGYV